MFLNDNGIQVLQWETMIPIEDIDVFDGRNGLVIPQKISHFEKVFRVEGFRLPLTGRRLPNGRVKLLCGHHRTPAAKNLGLRFIPMVLLPDDAPDQLGIDIYLGDNNRLLNLATPLIISAVRIADLNRQAGLDDSEHNSITGEKVGLDKEEVRDVRGLADGLDAKTMHPGIAEIANSDTAIQAYRLFTKYSLTVEAQGPVLQAVGQNPKDGLRILSRQLSKGDYQPARPRPKPKALVTIDELGDRVRVAVENFVSFVESAEELEMDPKIRREMSDGWTQLTQVCPELPEDNNVESEIRQTSCFSEVEETY
jgi:hypothetical protein